MDILLTLAEKIKSYSSESNLDLGELSLLYKEFAAEVRKKIIWIEETLGEFPRQKKSIGNTLTQMESELLEVSSYSDVYRVLRELVTAEFLLSANKFSAASVFNKNFTGIGYIYISEYAEIKKIQHFVPEIPSFIVFTGENARGKTMILQALAISLDESFHKISANCVISVFFYMNGQKVGDARVQQDFKTGIKPMLAAAYGTSRLLIQTPESMDANKRNSNVASLFRSDVSFLNIEYWLKMRVLAGEESKVNKVLEMFPLLIPHLTKASYKKDKKEGLVFEYEESGKIVRLEQLSAGQKSIIAFVGDMIIRLWEQQPEVETIADLEGIVLIDEIEAHLHPKWQREFPKLLHEIFPKVQFIVTTHSPIPLLGMPEDTALFHVTKDAEKGIQAERLYLDIKNMSPQQILTSPLFGIESLRSLYNENLKDFNTEENYQEMLKNKEVQDRIKALAEKFTFKEPEK